MKPEYLFRAYLLLCSQQMIYTLCFHIDDQLFLSACCVEFRRVFGNDVCLHIQGGGANGEMANLTNEKGKFAIAIFRHFSPFFAIVSFRNRTFPTSRKSISIIILPFIY